MTTPALSRLNPPLICTCGSQWFNLVMPDGDVGGVCMSTDMSIIGYAGFPVCRECGTPA